MREVASSVLPTGWGFKRYPPACWLLQMPNGRLATLVSCSMMDPEQLAEYLRDRMYSLEQSGGL